MIASLKDSDELQLNAYCDGELDPASASEFERKMANDEQLTARYERLMSLRQAVRSFPQPVGLAFSHASHGGIVKKDGQRVLWLGLLPSIVAATMSLAKHPKAIRIQRTPPCIDDSDYSFFLD